MGMYLCFISFIILITSAVYGINNNYDNSYNTTNVIKTFDPPQNFDLLDALSLLRADQFFRVKSKGFEALKNDSCGLQLLEYIDALRHKDPWAVKMFDSSSKTQPGIFEGNIVDLGMFDECIGINNIKIRGRYCTLTLNYTWYWILWKPKIAVCVPSTCDARRVQILLDSTINDFPVFHKLGIENALATCTRTEPEELSIGLILTILLFLIFIIMCAINTISQISKILYGKKKIFGFIGEQTHFSLYKNLYKLFYADASFDAFPALHGIRFFSMICVMLCHECVVWFVYGRVNNLDSMKWIFSWNVVYVFPGIFAVDTFLTIRGILVSHSFIKTHAQQGNINLFEFYLHRYFRLTPLLIIALLVGVFLMPRIGSGPTWDDHMDTFVQSCQTKWWTVPLYVHNFIDPINICMAHTWSLAVDMQLHWFCPLILYPIVKKPRSSTIIFGFSLLASLIIPGFVIFNNKYRTIFYDPNLSLECVISSTKDVYPMPHVRAGPFIVGLIFGHLMATNKVQLGKKTILTGILVSLIAFLSMAALYKVYAYDRIAYNVTMEIMFNAIMRPIWGLFISCLVYATTQNYGVYLLKFLSSPIFIPFSRISYSFYLIHLGVQILLISFSRTMGYSGTASLFINGSGTFVITCVLSVFLTVLFEYPIISLEKMLTGRKKIIKKE